MTGSQNNQRTLIDIHSVLNLENKESIFIHILGLEYSSCVRNERSSRVDKVAFPAVLFYWCLLS